MTRQLFMIMINVYKVLKQTTMRTYSFIILTRNLLLRNLEHFIRFQMFAFTYWLPTY